MRAIFLSLGLIQVSAAMAINESIYLQGIHAYTLGYPKVEFYEAYIVTDAQQLSAEATVNLLRPLCVEFPKLDTYMVRVFSDSKWAKPQSFDWGLGPSNSDVRKEVSKKYLAELRPDGTLISHPYQDGAKSTVAKSWCTKR